ncbi:MAG: SDR family oxidoreductase [Bdellovibrionales bacterium]|nr:SDR family oxidoreductase [Bdellovibrionales bacterium]
MTKSSIQDQCIFITGASRGIGKAIALHFGRLDAKVVLFARNDREIKNLEKQICHEGGQALAIEGDVSNYEDLRRAIELSQKHFSNIDILLNNAGLIEPIEPLASSDPEAWGKVIDVNLKGVYHAIRACLPHMIDRRKGTIINLSSGAAYRALEGWSHYCASKAAVLSITRSVHEEYQSKGVTVVGLSPGTVATHMQDAIKESGLNPVSQLLPTDHIPPEWVAKAVEYLCIEGAKEYAGQDFTLKTPEERKKAGLPK